MKQFTWSITLVVCIYFSMAQSVTIQSGPMNGYALAQETVLWVQLTGAAEVYAEAQAEGDSELHRSTVAHTQAEKAFTAHLYFYGLQSGTTYQYTLYVDGEAVERPYPTRFTTEPRWAYRSDPPAFTMALGSCLYINDAPHDRPGKPYGQQYEILTAMYQVQPDITLWLGDNIYLRDQDWWTRSGYLHRHTHTRSVAELQPLLAQGVHYAIWDDHDFGPNDATGSWVHKDWALETFQLFWANPSYGYPDLPSTSTAFRFADIDFFLMDDRYYRTELYSDSSREQVFGQRQIDRVIDLLKQSRAPFKIVAMGGQILNSAKVYENVSRYEIERAYFIDLIEKENIKGVIFINGDRHHSEVSRLELSNGALLHEFTVSPLTSGANQNVTETNYNRVAGSLIQQRNFATLSVSGAYRERVLTLTYYDSKGQQLYQFILDSDTIYK